MADGGANAAPLIVLTARTLIMLLPDARGLLSQWVIDTLQGVPRTRPIIGPLTGVLTDDDLQLALWICYELAFQGFDGIDDEAEWNTDVLSFRSEMERLVVDALSATIDIGETDGMARRLRKMIADDSGPSLSRVLHRQASLAQFREFVMHRSVYHLKEADPHTLSIPRLRGRAKAAMVEIQADEYGNGRVERMHSTLFATMMAGVDLDTGYGHYVHAVPGVTLATNNLMSLFGLHRRWRGAAAGHLASIEMTSSQPNRRYAMGLRRLGGSDAACQFFDEHVEADAVHEQIAAYDLCESLALDEPAIAGDILFGAAAALLLDRLFAQHVLAAWDLGRSSMRTRAEMLAA